MGTWGDILTYEVQLNNKIRKPNRGLIYTCNCGWIDASHADGRDAKKLWQKLLNEEGRNYFQQGILGFKESQKVSNGKLGVYITTEKEYLIKSGPNLSQKKQIALAIFKDFNNQVEQNQGSGIKGTLSENWNGTSFSEEDLVSNLVGFYDSLEGTSWHDLCKPASVDASKAIFKRDGIGTTWQTLNKNETFTPKFHACDECPTSVFPQQYQSIPDIRKGELFLDFNDSIAVREKDYDLFFGSFKDSPQGLLFQGIKNEVRLVVRGNETQRQFGHRALMKAARKAGLWLISEQTEYANMFYPPADFSTEVNFKLVWTGKIVKKIKPSEFNQKRGQYLTYELNDSELNELRKRKFLLP